MNLHNLHKQFGGTILGIIIGVLVGLGAALAVAIYVTKVPVPFVNKNQPRAADQDAAESKKNKDWDPNAPLYGKNPAKPGVAASGAVTPAPAAAASTATAGKPAASAAKATAKADTKTDTKISTSDPLGDLAKAKTMPKPAAATSSAVAVASPPSSNSGADPFTYFVQAGAFRTPEDAEAQRAKLSLLGQDAKVTEREQSGRTVYRVRLGPFNQKEDADRAKDKLDGNGIETAIVRIQR